MTRFRAVPIDEAREGAVLYDDVRDAAGNVLLPRATALDGAMLRALVRRGVATLHVVADVPAPDHLAAERARVRARLAYLCRHAGDGPANGLLRLVVEQYRLAELP
ncbi:hypothetical protein NX784_03970 [Massilia pinisoli]|uniref:Uncharacterized protein n=1 Tax=Massilia pinisoli TaxID=1772194 RepID=A0ABT1ZLF1_9BURK|nr:hypothetical protein [Massilia pinisoli]MCS0580742.1 hypothetical protein [Massilia pinisoli]